jgi:HSP20 family protein
MTRLAPFVKRARDIRGDMWDNFTDLFSENLLAAVRNDTHLFRTDIKDSGEKFVIEAELPGFNKEDIKVDYSGNYLTISALRESITKEENENFLRQERHFGEFIRRFYVENIDENAIDATFKNGILTLNCPKLMIPKIEQKLIEIH